ncbi:MAG: dienelactone hydrolase family protein [Simkania sp.]|nr:dienelactone hydrolase family protein [Simkania sp.]
MKEENAIKIKTEDVVLVGDLHIPQGATSIVLFAHGSGSSRLSPRNQFVAKVLEKGGLGTLLIDLLTIEEEKVDSITRHLRFDIPFLAKRLVAVIDWLENRKLNIGCFGASTGAAAALLAAAERPLQVKAVVSRGGRPDLAGKHLAEVKAPTLFIVGGDDTQVIELNEQAMQQLQCTKKLTIVPGATHLFEESGTLEEVSRLATAWFQKWLEKVPT